MNSIQLSNIKRISEASTNNKLVVFVGAGVSMNSGVPSWSQLIKALKQELPQSLETENDDLKVAQLYKNSRGHKEYFEKIKTELRCGKVYPNPIHDAILDLQPCHIITTNYDDLMEQTIRNRGLQYQIIKKDSDLPYTQYANMLIKMHGDFDTNNIVLTENDYYDYKDNYPLINAFIQSLFATKLVLFIGFSFNDMNLKMIINSMQKLLKKDFQPVYLLSDISNDIVHSTYFKSKGVNITWIPDELLSNIEINDSLKSELGIAVCKQLKYIANYSDGKNLNLLDTLYSRINSFHEEIPYFIAGLEYIWPKSDASYCNISPISVRNDSKFVQNISLKIKNFSEKKKLLKTNGKQISFLRNVALDNQIFQVNDLEIFTEKSFIRKWNQKNRDAIDSIYEFNFKAASEQIKELKNNPLKFSYRDLELPYAYFMLGRYFDAYSIYKEYANQYWETEKHILYFICMYNMKALRKTIYNENSSNPMFDPKKLDKQLKEIDLSSVLSKCQIDQGIKKYLSQLINYYNYLDLLEESNKLVNKIFDNKQLIESGGSSWNQDIESLECKICRCFNLSNVNYIINTNTSYAELTFINGITGILLGHLIPESKSEDSAFSSSRLPLLSKNMLLYMIYMISYNDFAQIFKRYEIDLIKLDDEAIAYLDQIIKNIDEQSELILSMNRKPLFIERFSNILLLSIKAKKQLKNKELLYNIAIKYSLVNNIKYRDVNDLLNLLSHQMREENIILSFITSGTQLNILLNIGYYGICNVASYYHLVNKEIQIEILQRFKSQYMSHDGIAELIVKYKIPIFDSNLLKKYIGELKAGKDINNLEYCIYALYCTFEKTTDFESKKIILEYSNECEFLKFLIKPRGYSIEHINKEWFRFCTDEDLKFFLKNDLCRKKIKEYIDGGNFSYKYLKKRVWNLL